MTRTDDVTDRGERVTHLNPNSSYYAHLSIYRFAAEYCRDRRVLDVGSGAGYGAHYLAQHGARSVHGVDISAKAVDFSRRHFRADTLRYDCLDAEEIGSLPAQSYDVIFTSNTLEHLAHVGRFLRGACAALAPDGLLIVAVPPITHEAARRENLENPYHLNIWSPAQWHHALSLYFDEVSCVRHHFDKPGVTLNFADTPETTRLDETDFLFLPITLEELSRLGALTAIFLARSSRQDLPAGDAMTYVDDSFTRTPPRQVDQGIPAKQAAAMSREPAESGRRRVLLISHDIVGPVMAGPGIRYLHLARVLANHAAVTLAIPQESPGKLEGESFGVVRYTRSAWQSLAPHVQACDICIFPSDIAGTYPQLAQSAAYLVVDGYDPLLAEWLALHGSGDADALAVDWRDRMAQLQRQYTLGDFYICASERQRDWWLGLLEANGRVNPAVYAADPSLRKLVDVVPYGLPDTAPKHTHPAVKGVWPGIGPDDKLILWGGGLWSWLDPVTAVRAVSGVYAQRPDVRLIFPGTRHPNPEMGKLPSRLSDARAAAQEAGLLDKAVFFGDWVPYADWANLLLECDVALSLHFDTLETRLAFRSRVLEYIWAGLPIVATEGDATAELVTRYGLGRVVHYEDVDGVTQAILDLLDAKQEERTGFRAAAEDLNWTRVAAPLIVYCRSPWHAADKAACATKAAYATKDGSGVYSPSLWAQLEQERAHWEALVQGYESGRFMRFTRWLERQRRRL